MACFRSDRKHHFRVGSSSMNSPLREHSSLSESPFHVQYVLNLGWLPLSLKLKNFFLEQGNNNETKVRTKLQQHCRQQLWGLGRIRSKTPIKQTFKKALILMLSGYNSSLKITKKSKNVPFKHLLLPTFSRVDRSTYGSLGFCPLFQGSGTSHKRTCFSYTNIPSRRQL